MLVQCSKCNRKMDDKDIDIHFQKKHLVEERGFRDVEVEYEGEVLHVVTDGEFYACKNCVFMSDRLKEIYKHDLMYHKLTYEEAKSLNRAKKPFCDVCWIEFEEYEYFDKHNISSKHIEKVNYVEGTGCDICRTRIRGFTPHHEKERHKAFLKYEKGTGCDLCATSKEDLLQKYSSQISNGETYESILSIHQAKDLRKQHKITRSYIQRSGCDICFSPIIEYIHNNPTHQIVVKRMETIRSKTRAKSARSVYK